MPTSNTLLRLNPKSSLCSFSRLRANSPAPVSRTIERPTCSTTISDDGLSRRNPLRRRFFSFIAEERFVRLACSAGISPNKRPATIDTPAVNKSTPASGRVLSGASLATSPTRTVTAHWANSTPHTPPISASNILSVSSCRTIRQRVAPRAMRKEISALREAARDNRRLPTLAQAINKTMPTIAISVCSGLEYALRKPEMPPCPSTSVA